ncbi:MAG: hypothetical protein ACTSP4_00680 [Candidatus Hodarchaeales archaeon]
MTTINSKYKENIDTYKANSYVSDLLSGGKLKHLVDVITTPATIAIGDDFELLPLFGSDRIVKITVIGDGTGVMTGDLYFGETKITAAPVVVSGTEKVLYDETVSGFGNDNDDLQLTIGEMAAVSPATNVQGSIPFRFVATSTTVVAGDIIFRADFVSGN